MLKSKNRLTLKVTVAAGCLLQFASTSFAATATTSLPVQITITASCTINSAATLNFGNPANLAAPVPGSTTLQLTCTNTTPYTIAMGAGGGTVAARLMGPVTYALYTDAAHTTLWGDGSLGTVTVAGTGNGGLQSVTIYGNVPTQTTPAPGIYTDSVPVTVTY